MTADERETMKHLLGYAVWCEKFWSTLRCKPSLMEIRMDIANAKALLEVSEDDA
jgi:hypothetical protein